MSDLDEPQDESADAENSYKAPRAAPLPSEHDPYSALRHRDFRLYLLATVAATVGMEMQSVAVGWDLYTRLGSDNPESKLALGLVGLVQALPVLMLALPAGHVADRLPRKWIVFTMAVLMTCGSFGLTAISMTHGPIPLVYCCLGAIGVAVAFSFPARFAFMTELVPEVDLQNAVTWRSSTWQSAAMLGPGVGGIIIGLYGPTSVYLLDGCCGIGVCLALFAIKGRPFLKKAADPMTWETLTAGFRFVWSTPLILAAITLDMFAVLLGGAVTLLPVYARDILKIGPFGLGLLRAAPSIGAVTMGLILAHRPPLKRAGRALLLSVVGFGVATIVFGLSRNPYLSFAMLVLTGVFDNISVVIRLSLIQLRTPDAMRGRISAVNSIFISMSNEVGGFESGYAAYLVGTVRAVVLGGLGCIAVVGLTALKWPEIRRLGPLKDIAASQTIPPQNLEAVPVAAATSQEEGLL